MRGWLAVTLLFGMSSCDATFVGDQMSYPDDIPCSDANTCPPNEVCVPGEHYCRYACRADGSCPNAHMGNGLGCDVDHFCRINCVAAQNPAQCGQSTNCPMGQVCDTTFPNGVIGSSGFCRPICSGAPPGIGCGTGFTCATVSNGSCSACRPVP